MLFHVTFVLLEFLKLNQEAVCDKRISYVPPCNKYQSCNSYIINSTTNETIFCNGAQSCNNSWIRSSSLWCDGYGSCCNTVAISYQDTLWGQSCDAYGTCMKSNLSAVNMIFCGATYSCSGSYLTLSEDNQVFCNF